LVAAQAVSCVVIPMLPLNRWLAVARIRMTYFGTWSGFAIISLLLASFLDGGATSPIVSALGVPMVYAAVI
jgi:hypothetical protein